ncbi:MAG TPA: phosphate ABC transporter substrate-binding protein PstS [Trebonia sp.]
MQLRGRKHVAAVGGAVLVTLLAAACSSSTTSPPSSATTGAGSSPTAASASGTLNGSGSSFQNTFQQAAISAFKSVDSGITVNYQSVGSGTGRSNLAAGTVNFAGSDSPIPDKETANFKGKKVLYFPVLIGPITMSYNLPGVSNLKLTPKVISDIFQAKVTKWNDPEITAINPGANLPGTAITPAVRSDSSGTTQNFALFLQTAVPNDWALGSSSTVKWPSSARAGAQNTGVAQIVKSTQGAIGYVDYADAKASGLHWASVQNKSGQYVEPSSAGSSASAAGVTVKPDLTFHAVWGTGATAYPITYQSWVLVYQQQPNANDVALLKAYIGYLIGDGQQLLGDLGYAPLPSNIDSQAKAQLDQITSS